MSQLSVTGVFEGLVYKWDMPRLAWKRAGRREFHGHLVGDAGRTLFIITPYDSDHGYRLLGAFMSDRSEKEQFFPCVTDAKTHAVEVLNAWLHFMIMFLNVRPIRGSEQKAAQEIRPPGKRRGGGRRGREVQG